MAHPFPEAPGCVSIALRDSNCDHRPFPERNNAGGMWRQYGVGSPEGLRSRRINGAIHDANWLANFAAFGVDKG